MKPLILIIVFLAQYSFAQETNEEVHKLNLIDETQRFITNQWIGLNYRLDMFFSEHEYEKSKNKSTILAYYSFYKKESLATKYDYDIKMRFHFPEISGRMRVVLERERDELVQSKENELTGVASVTATGTPERNLNQSNFNAGVSYFLPQTQIFKTFFDVGMRIKLPLDPYSKLRFQKSIDTKWLNLFFSQSFFLYRQDGFQEITQFSLSRKLNPKFLLELINTLSWADNQDIFYPRNNLILYYYLKDKDTLNFSLGASARLSPTTYYSSYDTTIGYRKLIHEDWFFTNFSVGADYPKVKNFKPESFILGRAEIFFR